TYNITRENPHFVTLVLLNNNNPCGCYLTLHGPRNAPVLKQAVRWKCTPMGRDAIPQAWYTGLTNRDNRDAWYTLTSGLSRESYHRWARSHAEREQKSLPPAYAQHLREVSWFDPVLPAQYLEPSTRWGAFRWQDRPVLGKEHGKSVGLGSLGLGEGGGFTALFFLGGTTAAALSWPCPGQGSPTILPLRCSRCRQPPGLAAVLP
uniref:Tektin bundle interacting protein 1 n=1 Tax=Chelonoidis abingdonii TaxID=106734 RepID=A0A8C0JC07_CHEAB